MEVKKWKLFSNICIFYKLLWCCTLCQSSYSFLPARRTSLHQSEPRWAPKMWFSRRFAKTSRWVDKSWLNFLSKIRIVNVFLKGFSRLKGADSHVYSVLCAEMFKMFTTKLHSLIFINDKLRFPGFFSSSFFCFFLVLFFSSFYIHTFVFDVATWQRDTFTEARIVSYPCFCHYRISAKRFLIREFQTGGDEPECFKCCLANSVRSIIKRFSEP